MKKITGAIILLLVIVVGRSQQQAAPTRWNVMQVTKVGWNTQSGIPYKQVPGANLGITSFQMMDYSRMALLSDANSEIIIVNRVGGRTLARFPVAFAPRDFAYDNGLFYILEERRVTVYDETGTEKKHFAFPLEYVGTVRITCYNKRPYLQLPSGNCFDLETNREHEGWITSTGNFIATKLSGRNAYSIKVITPAGKVFENNFKTDKKVAGAYVVGGTANRLFIDVQTFVSENPVTVERKVVAMQLTNTSLGNIITSKKLPECYYVLSNNDLNVASDGTVFHMVTSPQGLYMFSLKETKAAKVYDYPFSFQKMRYHFNDHLLRVDQ